MSKPRRLDVAIPAVSALLDNTAGRITWWSWRETTGGAPATFQLFDGSNDEGSLIVTISLTAGQSTRDYLGPHCLPYSTGLWLEVISGTFEGVVYALSEKEWGEGLPAVVIGEVDVNIVTGA